MPFTFKIHTQLYGKPYNNHLSGKRLYFQNLIENENLKFDSCQSDKR